VLKVKSGCQVALTDDACGIERETAAHLQSIVCMSRHDQWTSPAQQKRYRAELRAKAARKSLMQERCMRAAEDKTHRRPSYAQVARAAFVGPERPPMALSGTVSPNSCTASAPLAMIQNISTFIFSVPPPC
jgi:hypothetical protein